MFFARYEIESSHNCFAGNRFKWKIYFCGSMPITEAGRILEFSESKTFKARKDERSKRHMLLKKYDTNASKAKFRTAWKKLSVFKESDPETIATVSICRLQRKNRVSGLEIQAEASLSRYLIRFYFWTSTVKPFFGFCSQKPANPHEYWKKWSDIFFVIQSWARMTELLPPRFKNKMRIGVQIWLLFYFWMSRFYKIE